MTNTLCSTKCVQCFANIFNEQCNICSQNRIFCFGVVVFSSEIALQAFAQYESVTGSQGNFEERKLFVYYVHLKCVWSFLSCRKIAHITRDWKKIFEQITILRSFQAWAFRHVQCDCIVINFVVVCSNSYHENIPDSDSIVRKKMKQEINER